MKKIILLIMVCFIFTSAIQKQTYKDVTVTTDIFTVLYSQEFEQPIKLDYIVQCPGGGVSRKGLDFRGVKDIKTSDNNDYRNNVWDKGHLAPAADFNCDREMLKKTFSYLNCALQHEGLNQGPWRLLEEYERELALKNDMVKVTVVVHFENNYVLPTGAKIPSDFTKTIIIENDTLTYKFPNKNVRHRNWRDFEVK
tara:strand:+ start:21722 stop:22309 length:588 start_codon:yes stop_codon:yes gene_type:complete